jgi:hypothetical protein
MNLSRIALAALGGFVAYFVLGGLSFAVVPSLKTEFLKYPAVYRPRKGRCAFCRPAWWPCSWRC